MNMSPSRQSHGLADDSGLEPPPRGNVVALPVPPKGHIHGVRPLVFLTIDSFDRFVQTRERYTAVRSGGSMSHTADRAGAAYGFPAVFRVVKGTPGDRR